MNNLRFKQCAIAAAVAAALTGQSGPVAASDTYSVEATADTFITSYAPSGSYSGATASTDNSGYGAMMISAYVADPDQGIYDARQMETLIAYNTAPIKSHFDSVYGANGWHITTVQVKFYSNFDISGVPANNNQFNVPYPGYFILSLFSDNSWYNPSTAGSTGRSNSDLTWNNVYGSGGTYNGIFDDEESLGTFYYPTGDYNGTTSCANEVCAPRFWTLTLTQNLEDGILAGDYISLHGAPADEAVVYLINQMTKPYAHPQLFVTADAN
jgi:hypothetical protein